MTEKTKNEVTKICNLYLKNTDRDQSSNAKHRGVEGSILPVNDLLSLGGLSQTKILRNMQFVYFFFTEQGKTGKNETHGNENLATYFWYFGSFDEKQSYENM